MSSRSPRLTDTEVIKYLKKQGFVEVSQKGSHLKMFNSETRRTAIVLRNFSRIEFQEAIALLLEPLPDELLDLESSKAIDML